MSEFIKQINLKNRLKKTAIDGIKESNRFNPFISKSEAFHYWNDAKKL